MNFGIIALVLSGIAFLLEAIGLGIPYWLYYGNDLGNVHVGLWKACASIFGGGSCSSLTEFGFGDSYSASLNAARGMIIIAVVLLFGAIICHVMKMCVMKQQTMLPKVAGIAAILGGVFGLVGSIVYAAKFNQFSLAGGLSDSTLKLHAGFALCIIASVKGIVAGALSFLIRD